MQSIFTSIVAFVSTNIDDIFILTLFFASRKFTNPTIIIGQYLGISALVVVSVLGVVLFLLGVFIIVESGTLSSLIR